jgi:hypothetical protein
MNPSCPFSIGDRVRFEPGWALGKLLPDERDELTVGEIYEIAEIRDHDYLVLKGHEHLIGGGIHWEIFKPIAEGVL